LTSSRLRNNATPESVFQIKIRKNQVLHEISCNGHRKFTLPICFLITLCGAGVIRVCCLPLSPSASSIIIVEAFRGVLWGYFGGFWEEEPAEPGVLVRDYRKKFSILKNKRRSTFAADVGAVAVLAAAEC
jgi:hypothetical protein